MYTFLKHFILAEALPSKEIIIVVCLFVCLFKCIYRGEIASNKASWTGSEFPHLGSALTMELTSFRL